jgi:hypothetical protein
VIFNAQLEAKAPRKAITAGKAIRMIACECADRHDEAVEAVVASPPLDPRAHAPVATQVQDRFAAFAGDEARRQRMVIWQAVMTWLWSRGSVSVTADA